MNDLDFTGQVAIVTGAARGLGRTYAMELARRGASVVVNDANTLVTGLGLETNPTETPQRVVDEIIDEGGIAVASTASVTDEDGGESIVEQALSEYGRVDIVIPNAGIVRSGPFERWSVDDVKHMIDTHVLGAFRVAKPAYAAMRKAGYGRFVFIGSSSGMWGHTQVGYSIAKAGVHGLMKAVALEGAQYGIHANVVQPVGWTRMAVPDGQAMDPPAAEPGEVSEAERVLHETIGPLRARTEPEFVTPMTVYLCSKACTYNGLAFSAAAGRYARVNVGFGPGWQASFDGPPTVEEIAAHLDEINPPTDLVEPRGTMDELFQIAIGLEELRAATAP